MAAPSPSSLLLFVAGDPDLAHSLGRFPRVTSRLLGFFIPPSLVSPGTEGAPLETDGMWLVPADQLMCAERLAETVKGSPYTVRMVDVNRPGDDRPLVERYVTAQDVLPIVVRPDGSRLVGLESFTPGSLRRFLQTR